MAPRTIWLRLRHSGSGAPFLPENFLVYLRAMRSPALLVLLFVSACTGPVAPPSLLPRAAEAIDPRVPVERPMNDRPVDPALASRLAALVDQARSGDSAFQPAAAEAERLAAAAGAPQSEGWIAAQQALSAAIAARDPTVKALGDIDLLGADRLQVNGGLSPNDLAAITQAGAEVGAIDERQARTIKSLQNRLAR